MNTTLMKLFRDALMTATGKYLTAQERATRKNFRTGIIENTLMRKFALQKLSHLHSPGMDTIPLHGQTVKHSYSINGRTLE
jgi:hypothetical protein